MSTSRRAALATLAALILVPATSAAAQDDPTEHARATLLSAAVLTSTYGDEGFHSTATAYNGSYTTKVEAWTDGFNGDATTRTTTTSREGTVTVLGGSYTTWTQDSGTTLTAWSKMNPKAKKADQRVMRKLPPKTRYVTGPAPSGPVRSPLSYAWGFTAAQVTKNLSNTGYLTWNVASRVATCGDTEEGYEVTCTGSVQTVSGNQKVWRMTVTQSWEGEQWDTDILAKSDRNGVLTYVEYTDPASTSRTVLKLDVGGNSESPWRPKMTSRNTAASQALTQAAATSDVRTVASNFRSDVTKFLAKAGKNISVKNVNWAYEKLSQDGRPFYRNTSQWSDGVYWSGLPGMYDVTAFATDGITASSATAAIDVKDGKILISFPRTTG